MRKINTNYVPCKYLEATHHVIRNIATREVEIISNSSKLGNGITHDYIMPVKYESNLT
jgi:hypothetical protein